MKAFTRLAPFLLSLALLQGYAAHSFINGGVLLPRLYGALMGAGALLTGGMLLFTTHRLNLRDSRSGPVSDPQSQGLYMQPVPVPVRIEER